MRQYGERTLKPRIVKPTITYNVKTRTDSSTNNQNQGLRRIVRKNLLGTETSKNVTRICNVSTLNECVLRRKKEWNEHSSRRTTGKEQPIRQNLWRKKNKKITPRKTQRIVIAIVLFLWRLIWNYVMYLSSLFLEENLEEK